MASVIAFGCNCAVLAQDKEDNVKLKADIEAIRQGKEIKINQSESILFNTDTLPLVIDTAALKPGMPIPTPPSPNNPNPYSPMPNVVNPNSPATTPADPAIPPGVPKGPGSTVKKGNER